MVTPKYNSNLVSDIKYNKVSYTIDFDIDVSKALNIKEINSPSHDINIIDKEDKVVEASDKEDIAKKLVRMMDNER